MSTDQSVFKFDLNESLFFEKGQEVAEMRGISLDPEISIQAYNEYISIKGVIELRGEYLQVDVDEEDEEDSLLDFGDLHVKRYIEKVVVSDDYVAEFTHRFPIEISVPTYRVTDFNEVTVSVDSFDYEVPEESQLRLYATIAIHGINHEVEHPQLVEERAVEPELNLEKKGPEVQSSEKEFEVESKEKVSEVISREKVPEVQSREKELEVQSKEKVPEVQSREKEPEVESKEKVPEVQSREKELEVESKEKVSEVQSRGKELEVESKEKELLEISREVGDTFQFEIKQKQEIEASVEGNLIYEENAPILANAQAPEDEEGRVKIKSQSFADFFGKSNNEVLEEVEDDDDLEDEVIETIEVNQDDYSEHNDANAHVEDVSYLSDVFRSSEENQYIKMRLCIVQKDDTIDTIAERFQVSPLQLIKQNQLEEDFDVSAGQLLYIPTGKK